MSPLPLARSRAHHHHHHEPCIPSWSCRPGACPTGAGAVCMLLPERCAFVRLHIIEQLRFQTSQCLHFHQNQQATHNISVLKVCCGVCDSIAAARQCDKWMFAKVRVSCVAIRDATFSWISCKCNKRSSASHSLAT
jgi:hypothetical protein